MIGLLSVQDHLLVGRDVATIRMFFHPLKLRQQIHAGIVQEANVRESSTKRSPAWGAHGEDATINRGESTVHSIPVSANRHANEEWKSTHSLASVDGHGDANQPAAPLIPGDAS